MKKGSSIGKVPNIKYVRNKFECALWGDLWIILKTVDEIGVYGIDEVLKNAVLLDDYEHTERIVNPKGSLYFLIKNKHIVYIGESIFLTKRIKSHLANKEFDSISFFEYSTQVLKTAEYIHIACYLPKYNGLSKYHSRLNHILTLPPRKSELLRKQANSFIRNILSNEHKRPNIQTLPQRAASRTAKDSEYRL